MYRFLGIAGVAVAALLMALLDMGKIRRAKRSKGLAALYFTLLALFFLVGLTAVWIRTT